MVSMDTAIKVACAAVGTTLILWYSGPIASFAIRSYLDYMCPPPASTQLPWSEWVWNWQAIRNSTAYATGCGALKEQTSYRVFKFIEDISESWLLKGAAPLAFYHVPNIPSWFKARYKKWFGRKDSEEMLENIPNNELNELYRLFKTLNRRAAPKERLTNQALLPKLNSYIDELGNPENLDTDGVTNEQTIQMAKKNFSILFQFLEARQQFINEQAGSGISRNPIRRPQVQPN